MLDMTGIGKTYFIGGQRLDVLCGVDLRVDVGEFVALLGPSGSGKSTLLNIAGGLQRPDAGHVQLSGRSLERLSDRQLSHYRRRSVGFVFQSFNLCPQLTALENVELPLMYAGVRHAERAQRARDALLRVDMGDRLRHKPGELSGGQCQRVAIARAIVCEPGLILADEPTGNLDGASGHMVMELFLSLWQAGYGIIMVTHDERQAMLAQRVVRMNDGRIVG